MEESEKIIQDEIFQDKIEIELQNPTPPEAVNYLPKIIKKENALCIPFISREFITNRLDKVVGPTGWQLLQSEAAGHIITTIAIHVGGRGWVHKSDTGYEISEAKGRDGITSGIKRAGRLWGIGRDVGGASGRWLYCETKPNGAAGHTFVKWKREPSLDLFLNTTMSGKDLIINNDYREKFLNLCNRKNVTKKVREGILQQARPGPKSIDYKDAYMRAAIHVINLQDSQKTDNGK